MLTAEDFKPEILCKKFLTWYQEREDFIEKSEYREDQRYTVYIFRKDKYGAYLLRGGKLCWSDVPEDQLNYNRIQQNDLFINSKKLGKVVVYDRQGSGTTLVGKSFESAIEKINRDL